MHVLILFPWPSVEDISRGGLGLNYSAREVVKLLLSVAQRMNMDGKVTKLSVFSRPQNLKIFKKTEFIARTKASAEEKEFFPPYGTNGFLVQKHHAFFKTVQEQLDSNAFDLIFAIGPIACWAVLPKESHSKVKGFISIREKDSVPVVVCPSMEAYTSGFAGNDEFEKCAEAGFGFLAAQTTSGGAEYFPERSIIYDVSAAELSAFVPIMAKINHPVGVDIETAQGMIQSIAFCYGRNRAFVVKFFDNTFESLHSEADEVRIFNSLKEILAMPFPKVFQNGNYDATWLTNYGLPVREFRHDTMIMENLISPEVSRSLQSLATRYARIFPWKSALALSKVEQ